MTPFWFAVTIFVSVPMHLYPHCTNDKYLSFRENIRIGICSRSSSPEIGKNSLHFYIDADPNTTEMFNAGTFIEKRFL